MTETGRAIDSITELAWNGNSHRSCRSQRGGGVLGETHVNINSKGQWVSLQHWHEVSPLTPRLLETALGDPGVDRFPEQRLRCRVRVSHEERKTCLGTSPGGPVVKNQFCKAGDAGSTPGRGNKFPYASEQLNLRAAINEPRCHN